MIRKVLFFLCIVFSYQSLAIHKESASSSNIPFFIENKGQLLSWDRKPCPEVLYYAFLEKLQIFVMKDRIVYQWSKEEEKDTVKKGVEEISLHPFDAASQIKLSYSTYRMDMILENSNAQVESQASNPKPGMYHYFLGHLPKEGVTNLKGYARIKLKNVYKGIDWHIYFDHTAQGYKLKYDFVVAPHSSYSPIQWHYSHATSHTLLPSGAIEVQTPFGSLTEPAPIVWQGNKILSSKFVYDSATSSYSYAIKDVEPQKELRIDPEVDWASYYGGTGYDNITGLYMDSSDNMYMLMVTNSIGLSKNGYQNNIAGNRDILYSKRDKNKALIWASYYGGAISGVQAVLRGGNFWTGNPTVNTPLSQIETNKIEKLDVESKLDNPNTKMEYNSEHLKNNIANGKPTEAIVDIDSYEAFSNIVDNAAKSGKKYGFIYKSKPLWSSNSFIKS